MTTSRRTIVWVGLLAVGLGLIGLGVFVRVGLEKTNQWASVLGLFVSLGGLGLSGYGVALARRSTPTAGPSAPASGAVPGQSVSGTVGHDNIQIGQAHDVNIR